MRRPDLYVTDWQALWYLAKRRGVEHPDRGRVICSNCGAELAQSGTVSFVAGLVHAAPDCYGDFQHILFLEPDGNGGWKQYAHRETGRQQHDPTRAPLIA